MDSANDPSGQVGNENISANESDEANVTMDSTENTSGQFQKKISLSIRSEAETSSGMDDNLSGKVEEPSEDFTSESFCNSENKMHTRTDDQAQALKYGMALPECLSLGENKKRSLPIDDNELRENDSEEGKRPTAKKIRTHDQSECMAAEDEIMEERNEFMQNIAEESQHSAKDYDIEVKGDDTEGEGKSSAMNNRTDNESGCMAVKDEIMVEKSESIQNIDEELYEKSLHLAEDHDNEVKVDDAEVEQNPSAKENGTNNRSGYMAADDEIMEEKNEFMQNTGEESQHSAEDRDNEVKWDDAEEQQNLIALENRTADESGCMAVEDEIMGENNEFMQNIDDQRYEESLHLAEDHDNEVKEEDAEEEQNPSAKENGIDNHSGYIAAEDEIMEEKNEFLRNTGEESQHSADDHDNEVKRDDAEEQLNPIEMENSTADESGYMTAQDEIMAEGYECTENVDEESLHSAEDQEEVISVSDDDKNEDDFKDKYGLEYDEDEDDLEDDDDEVEDDLEDDDDKPLNEVDIFDPLTNEEEIIVKLALSEKYSNEVLVEHPNIDEDITGSLLECLRPEYQLNSDLVDVYLQLLKEREKNNPNKFLRCHFFNSFFYESIARVFKTGDLESIMRNTEKLEYQLIDCEKIFVPIYDSGAHWVVITIDIKQKRIQYLDPILSGMNHQAISIIAWYIQAEAKQRSGIDLYTDSWEKEAPVNIPSQENENDGGVLMLKYIDFISRNLPLGFNQEDIPLFRKKILIEILNMPGASRKLHLGWPYDQENATDESNELSIEGLLEPLNEAEKVTVQSALWRKNREVVLIKHPNISESITGGLLQCLRPNQWLSGDIINVYLVALKEREKNDPENFPTCHFFNTFFYTSLDRDLKTESITSIMRKTRRLQYELVNCDKIFVPVNDNGDHWVVVVIDIQRKKIQYLDSLLGENRNAMKVIAWYIKEEAKQKSKIDLDTESWKMEFPKNIPTQKNNYDCGVFMLKYIDFLSRGLPLNFQQSHIPLFREKLVLEILNIPGCSNRIKLE